MFEAFLFVLGFVFIVVGCCLQVKVEAKKAPIKVEAKKAPIPQSENEVTKQDKKDDYKKNTAYKLIRRAY